MMGSFLEPPAAILILTPLLLPIVQAVGVDPIHFGIIMAVNLSMGMYALRSASIFLLHRRIRDSAWQYLPRRSAIRGD